MATFYVQFANGTVIRTPFPQYHAEAKRLTKAEGERLYREQCRADLLTWIKPDTTIYTVLRGVSSSGMSRRVSLFAVKDGAIVSIDHSAATLLGWKHSDKGGIVVNGVGMDAGFHLVYSLGRALWPNGTPEPHGTRNGEPDSNGGYALRQVWL